MRQDRDALARLAEHHTKIMDEEFARFTEQSIKNTTEYTGTGVYSLGGYSRHNVSYLEVQGFTTEQAITVNELPGKTAVLNFASYKNPGGGFINGMTAQEEAICHSSNLYNILRNFGSYYNWNRKNLNSGLYLDRALYTPDVIFNCGKTVDVITCAAPNLSPIIRYNSVEPEVVLKWQVKRIAFLCNIIRLQNVDTVILGAWGCGVFKNDPYTIAYLFKYFLDKLHGQVKTVIFAIPESNRNNNFKIFNDVLVRRYKKEDRVQTMIDKALEEYEATLD